MRLLLTRLLILYTIYRTPVMLSSILQLLLMVRVRHVIGWEKKIKALQKTLSWYKKTKATFQKKLRQLEHQTSDSDTRAPCVTTAKLEEYSDEDSFDTDSDGTASMDYSSFEESSHSEIDKDITRNTVRWVWCISMYGYYIQHGTKSKNLLPYRMLIMF